MLPAFSYNGENLSNNQGVRVARKDALRLRCVKTTGDAGVIYFETDQVTEHQIWCLEQIAWEIDKSLSGGNLRARIYIKTGGYNHYLEEEPAVVADTLYTYTEKPYIHEGEVFGLELDQAQASTKIQLFITGYREEAKRRAENGDHQEPVTAPEQ